MVLDRGHGGHRRVLLAALGCLIVSGWWEGAQAEGGSPVPQPGQAVGGKPEGRAEQEHEPAPKPTWPQSIIDAEKASRAECGDAEECRSDQRDYSDLRAQWQAADAAQGQQTLALVQTIIAAVATVIAGIGTALLVSTFRETKRTADAAISANEINKSAYIVDQRPWVSIRLTLTGDLFFIDNGVAGAARIVITNLGKTPAESVNLGWKTFADALKGDHAGEINEVVADVAKGGIGSHRTAGFNLLPGEDKSVNIDVGLMPGEVLQARRESMGFGVGIVVVVAVHYRFKLQDHPGLTAKAYAVREVGESGEYLPVPVRDQGTVPHGSVTFDEGPGGISE